MPNIPSIPQQLKLACCQPPSPPVPDWETLDQILGDVQSEIVNPIREYEAGMPRQLGGRRQEPCHEVESGNEDRQVAVTPGDHPGPLPQAPAPTGRRPGPCGQRSTN